MIKKTKGVGTIKKFDGQLGIGNRAIRRGNNAKITASKNK